MARDMNGKSPSILNKRNVVVRSYKSGMGHVAELAAAVLNDTKLLPHAAFIVSDAERIIVEFKAELEDKEVE